MVVRISRFYGKKLILLDFMVFFGNNCQRSDVMSKSNGHLLFFCSFVQVVWRASSFSFIFDNMFTSL
ncbi:hypothetical protein GQ457_10G018470 [Hibiscus cannabinus]